MKTFVFRVDASIDIGTGHVMRCLTLAVSLRAEGHRCHFISREHTGHLIRKIQEQGFEVHVLPFIQCVCTEPPATYSRWLGTDWKTDAHQTLDSIRGLHVDWLIVDHYAIDQNWELCIHHQYPALRIMVIDDLANRRHHCHVLLDQNLNRNADDYRQWVGAECKVFAGIDYSILRTEFRELRRYSLNRRSPPSLKSLLVNMGGVDKDDATGLVLATLCNSALPTDILITVVMGEAAPHIRKVESTAARMQFKTRIVVNANNMAQLMADSDLAIGAAGSTSWERCYMGLPALLVVLAENQQSSCDALHNSGAALSIGKPVNISQRLPMLIKELSQYPEKLKQISENAAALCSNAGYHQLIHQLSGASNEQ